MSSGREKLTRISSVVLDCIFPQFCLNCNEEGSIVCTLCEKKLLDQKSIFWFPGAPIRNEHAALWQYIETNFPGKIIQALKYQFVVGVGSIIQRAIKIYTETYSDFFMDIDLIVVVPLHRRRLAERGFNQADIIANIIATELQVKNNPKALSRIRATEQQAKLGLIERQKNVHEAFRAEEKLVKGKVCLLVDDVYTTGSTMKEARVALINAGALEVRTFTLARPVH